MEIQNILFIVFVVSASTLFALNVKQIIANINMGNDLDRSDNKAERFKVMTLVALGQKKMFQKPLPALLHMCIYVAFIFTQIELIEIFIDGVAGTHRVFWPSLGSFYVFIISLIEVLSVLAFIATFIFLARRNLLKIPRFHKSEMTGWPKLDGNLILYGEIVLIIFIFMMNGADEVLHVRGESHAAGTGSYGFAISSIIGPALFDGLSSHTLHVIEKIGWWGHIGVVFAFLNYLPISKHFHIMLAFPNVFYSNLEKKGKFTNMESVTKEVKLMFDPNADPYATPPPAEEGAIPEKFGAKDVTDLSWKSILDAYTCTECGRCTSECPANQTGKLLSPRKIMMDTRDRAEELGKARAKNGADHDDGKSLLRDFVSEEELWACTTCNACVQACPVNIDPLHIILEMRRYLVMEESKSPSELTTMFTNVENNGAPWQFSPMDRFNWANEE